MLIYQRRLRLAVDRGERISQVGYTLIELIIVLLLLGILAASAVPAWLTFVQRQKIRTAAGQLQLALQVAKSEATKNSVRYALTACSNPPNSAPSNRLKYSVHPYSQSPSRFTTIKNVSIIKSTIRRSPARYNLIGDECYTTYLGLFPSDGYALGFFYLSNDQKTYIHRVGFNTLIGNIISCPVFSLQKARCQR